ncbi:MAG: 3-dehydroquinate synthase [Treponema sp.]|nr:3-dehydroquinate synthase [Treponema sp.]
MSCVDFSLSYPPINPGTSKTDIFFYDDIPNLSRLFFKDHPSTNRRLFVTDVTISQLPSVKPFIDSFSHNSAATQDQLIIIPAGESAKTIDTVLTIVKAAINANFNRKDTFVGIGGGVITDMTAFAASIFKRGAHAEFVPTTLLAMVDAAIGGKTGCDFDNYKNMIGAFLPASSLYIYPSFVTSLSDYEYSSGLAEVVKTALLFSPELFDFITKHKADIQKRVPDALHKIISECIKAKASIVEQDFTEQNIRMYLNLGHTFGHALESIAGLGTISHGTAVAWGIGRATELSKNMHLCSESYASTVLSVLKLYGWDTAPIHNSVKDVPNIGNKLIEAMKKDKKNSSNCIKLILQTNLAENCIKEVETKEILKVLS